jgi:hypothetical protein
LAALSFCAHHALDVAGAGTVSQGSGQACRLGDAGRAAGTAGAGVLIMLLAGEIAANVD